MEAAVLTLSFDRERGAFPSEELEDFCLNKKVYSVEGKFFVEEEKHYWSIFIQFERVVAAGDGVKDLSPAESKAYEELVKWRKDIAHEAGYPAYLIATNKHLVMMVKKKVRSLSGFGGIKGFGTKRIQKYGKDILHILQKFQSNEHT